MDPFDSLGGHYGLQTASEVRSDLRFEISDLNYIHIHVDVLNACRDSLRSHQTSKKSLGQI